MPTTKQHQPTLGMDSLSFWVPFLTRNLSRYRVQNEEAEGGSYRDVIVGMKLALEY